MAEAWIRGKSAPLDDAIAEAANIVAGSRQPVIAGLGTDVAGARAAIKLARLVGGVVDHMHSGALLRDLDVVREAGMMVTMPTEAHVRADLLLLVGPGLIEAWPALPERLFAKRRVVWLCPDAAAVSASTYENVAVVGDNPAELPAIVALLRARCAGRPVANAPIALATIDALVAELRRARFGVRSMVSCPARQPHHRDVVRARERPERGHALLGPAAGECRQCRRGAAGRWLDDWLSVAHRIWARGPPARSLALRSVPTCR